MKLATKLLATMGAVMALAAPMAHAADEIKIGFLVKQAEEPWFQDEWKFAEQAGKEKGFKVVKIGTPSGDKLLSAIDNLAAQKAQGFIVCVPDVKLGPAIVAKAKQHNLKIMTVDDRLVDGAGKPIETAIMGVKKGGMVTLVGNITPKVEIPLQVVVSRQIRLQGSAASSGEFPQCIDLLNRGAIKVDPIISALAPLEQGADWFERLYSNEPGLMKVVLQPGV